MRIVLPALIALAAASASGCAMVKTYQTQLDVCSGTDGSVQSAKVTKSSGDTQIDQHAIEKVASAMVYKEGSSTTCHPVTVEYRLYGKDANDSPT